RSAKTHTSDRPAGHVPTATRGRPWPAEGNRESREGCAAQSCPPNRGSFFLNSLRGAMAFVKAGVVRCAMAGLLTVSITVADASQKSPLVLGKGVQALLLHFIQKHIHALFFGLAHGLLSLDTLHGAPMQPALPHTSSSPPGCPLVQPRRLQNEP